MGGALAESRERFCVDDQAKVVAYETSFDTKNYCELYQMQSKNKKDYEERKISLNEFTKRQLETHIGERFNVLLSKTRYKIKNGSIFTAHIEEPFMHVLVRGRDYRRKYGSPVDWPREQAEVEGFEKIEQVLCNPSTEVSTMMLSISPPGNPGSSYQHNFYDIFTLREDHSGRHIEARRYSSALNNWEYAQKVRRFYPTPFIPTDVYFLSAPIQISKDVDCYIAPDDIHYDFHKDHSFLSEEKFQEILKVCGPLIISYINLLSENPFDESMQILIFNAILNKADQTRTQTHYRSLPIEEEIYWLGNLPVRHVMAACGPSSGASKKDSYSSLFEGSFSVSEFGGSFLEDNFGSREVECPECRRINIRPENQLLKKCQHCGSARIAC